MRKSYFFRLFIYLCTFTNSTIQWNKVSKPVQKNEKLNRILFKIMKFIHIFLSFLKCNYVPKNFSTKVTVDKKQPQSNENTASSPLCIQFISFEWNSSCSCFYEICTMMRNFPYIEFTWTRKQSLKPTLLYLQ